MAGHTIKFHEELEAALDLLAEYDNNAHGWRPVGKSSPEEEYQISYRDGPPGTMELNVRMGMPVPIKVATNWFRAGYPKDTPYAEMMEEFVCLKSFGPGDMICSVRFCKRYAALVDLLLQSKFPNSFGDKMLVRLINRRDHPKPGHLFFGCVALEQTGPRIPTWGMVIREGPDPDTTALNEVWRFPAMPPDLFMPVVEQMCRLYSGQKWDADPVEIEQKHGFIIMAIRKCCRGPPLLPIAPQEGNLEPLSEEWLDALTWDVYEDPMDFKLPTYLRHLLDCFGKREVEVFDSLDGRHLLFYQASARRADWLEIWGVWQLFQRRHSAAYRWHHGGSGAPGFQGDAEPRFGSHYQPVSEAGSSSAPTTAEIEAEENEDFPWSSGLPVKNTFVHFRPDRAAFDLQSSPM